MSIKKLKKIPHYLLMLLLTLGASSIIGFLSFAGMLALFPAITILATVLAISSAVLSFAYESEIYFQNIKGAFSKLFLKRNYLKKKIANDYLLEHFPTEQHDCPQFFKDYKKQLKLLHKFSHKRLDKKSKAQKKRVEKTLSDMEKWFAIQLFSEKEEKELTDYQKELRQWLDKKHARSESNSLLKKRNYTFKATGIFSVLSAAFMTLGSTYLISNELIGITFLASIASLPYVIVPMAIIAGVAYGCLVYNAITDMINNQILRTWYHKIRQNFKNQDTIGKKIKNILIITASIALLVLAIALTICTAGTWWTVAQHAKPLFDWMSKIPSFIMPIITGFSALMFNVEQINTTLDTIDEQLTSKDEEQTAKDVQPKENIFQRIKNSILTSYHALRARENWWQIFNPFRILLKLTVTPLRIIFFLGHLISIGVSSDRLPGIPEIASALLGIISEGFEDYHYFFGHDEHEHYDERGHHDKHKHHDEHGHTKLMLEERLSAEHGHDHNDDIPTKVLKFLFTPLYFLATIWAYQASKRNASHDSKKNKPHVLSWEVAKWQQYGQKPKESVEISEKTRTKLSTSSDWKHEHADYLLANYQQKHLDTAVIKSEIASKKTDIIIQLQTSLRSNQAFHHRALKSQTNINTGDCQQIIGSSNYNVGSNQNHSSRKDNRSHKKHDKTSNNTANNTLRIEKDMKKIIDISQDKQNIDTHRLPFFNKDKTKTRAFLDKFPEKIGLSI